MELKGQLDWIVLIPSWELMVATMLSVYGRSSKGNIGVFRSRELSKDCSTERTLILFLVITSSTPKQYSTFQSYVTTDKCPKLRGTHQRDDTWDSGLLGAHNAGPHHLPEEALAHILWWVPPLTLAAGSPHCNRRHLWSTCLLLTGMPGIPQRGPLHTFCEPTRNYRRRGKIRRRWN